MVPDLKLTWVGSDHLSQSPKHPPNAAEEAFAMDGVAQSGALVDCSKKQALCHSHVGSRSAQVPWAMRNA